MDGIIWSGDSASQKIRPEHTTRNAAAGRVAPCLVLVCRFLSPTIFAALYQPLTASCMPPEARHQLYATCRLPITNCQSSVAKQQLPSIICQLSITNDQLSITNCPSPIASHQLTIIHCQSPIDNHQLPIISCQSSIADHNLWVTTSDRGEWSAGTCWS